MKITKALKARARVAMSVSPKTRQDEKIDALRAELLQVIADGRCCLSRGHDAANETGEFDKHRRNAISLRRKMRIALRAEIGRLNKKVDEMEHDVM